LSPGAADKEPQALSISKDVAGTRYG
jgi:hypothetical protein